MKKLIYITTLFLLTHFAWCQSISASGSWYPVVDAAKVTEAGLDYSSTYALESSPNHTLINLQRGGSFFAVYLSSWRVDVRKIDSWNNSLKLEIKRTNTGNGQGFFIWPASISGGSNYIPLNNTDSQFFTGNGIFTSIPIQYKLSGFSVLIPVRNYSTEVQFTLIDL